MSAINSMTTWQKYFNQAEAAKSTGIIFGVFTVGGVSSFFLSATLPDLIGRRKAMFVPNSILIIGAIITALAINMPMFLVGESSKIFFLSQPFLIPSGWLYKHFFALTLLTFQPF
jgi:MFS family permease